MGEGEACGDGSGGSGEMRKYLRIAASAWLMLIAGSVLFWIVSGIWLLHWPITGDERFLMGFAIFMTSFGCAMVLGFPE